MNRRQRSRHEGKCNDSRQRSELQSHGIPFCVECRKRQTGDAYPGLNQHSIEKLHTDNTGLPRDYHRCKQKTHISDMDFPLKNAVYFQPGQFPGAGQPRLRCHPWTSIHPSFTASRTRCPPPPAPRFQTTRFSITPASVAAPVAHTSGSHSIAAKSQGNPEGLSRQN